MTTLHSPEETLAWGRRLAAELRAGDVVALCGNLGAGKTHAAKGIVGGLQSSAEVTSPTFTLVHEYTDGRLPVYHFDFYRTDTEAGVLSLGWDEYLDEPGVMIVEWADRFPRLMPHHTRWFYLEHAAEGTRIVRDGKEPR